VTVRIVFTADPIVSDSFVDAVDIALDVDSTAVDGNTTTLTVDFVPVGRDVESEVLGAWVATVSAFPLEYMKLHVSGLPYEDLDSEHDSEACERCGWRIEYAHIGDPVPVRGNEWLRLRTLVIRCTNPECEERFGRDARA
jgi:hypothetical protein